MNEINTTDAIDELVLPLRAEINRRDLLKRIGAGSLAVASAAVLSPLGAAAAKANYIDYANLVITPRTSDAVITVQAAVQLSRYAVNAIKAGSAEYALRLILWEEDNYAAGNRDEKIANTYWWPSIKANQINAQRRVIFKPYTRTFTKAHLRSYCDGKACRFYGGLRFFRYDDDDPNGKELDQRVTNIWERRL